MSAITSFPELTASKHASRTLQPLTELMDKMKPSHSSKPIIKLSLGDPTADGNLLPPQLLTDAMVDIVKSNKFNDYPPVAGYDRARKAVAEYWSRYCDTEERKAQCQWDKVILTSGGSHAIVLTITALCNEGDNVILCAPAFPHYKAVCDSYGVECRYCPLDCDKNWEVDFDAAEKLVDERTKCFIFTNPSNPCGSNYSRDHVQKIIHFCEKHNLPVIGDEIYSDLVFKGETFTSVTNFDTALPRCIISGTAKNMVTPGWRIGWLMLVDPTGAAKNWFKGMDRLSQLHTGSNSICQEGLARTLVKCPQSHYDGMVMQLEAGAKVYNRLLEHNIGITFDKPRASMFVMLKIDYSYFKDISSDMEFYEKLLDEQNVQLVPGEIMGMTGFCRATISRPPVILNEAIDRVIEFCEHHKK